MMWIDPMVRVGQLARAAIAGWDGWNVGVRRAWCHETARFSKKYRKIIWISLSVKRGWRWMKEVHEFFHSVVDGTPEADPAIFEKDPAVDEKDRGRES